MTSILDEPERDVVINLPEWRQGTIEAQRDVSTKQPLPPACVL